jgi:uncharacterized protein YjiS (DUF1127 family)
MKFAFIAILVLIAGYMHFLVRRWAANIVTRNLLNEIEDADLKDNYTQAFRKNSNLWRSLFNLKPAGWGRRTRNRLAKVLEDTNAYIQKLNDMYTNPSGEDRHGDVETKI